MARLTKEERDRFQSEQVARRRRRGMTPRARAREARKAEKARIRVLAKITQL